MVDLYFFVIMIVSAFLQTVTGFGFAIMTAPLLALVLGAKLTIMITLVASLLVKIIILVRNGGADSGSFKDIWLLMVASLIAGIPGAYLLKVINNEALKLFIGVVLLITGVIMWRNVKVKIKRDNLAKVITGAISGFLGATTSVNGPPIVIYFVNAGAESNKNSFRGNLTRYFLLSNAASLVYAAFLGVFKFSEVSWYMLLSLPALLIGYLIGNKVFYKIDAKTFKQLTLSMIFISSVMLIGTTLWKM